MGKSYDGKSGVRIKKPPTKDEIDAVLRILANTEVLVGFPEDSPSRTDDGNPGINNASLAYIHDNGAPEQNIPARPFMVPGIEAAQDQINKKLLQIGRAALRPGAEPGLVERGLAQVGLIAKLSIQNTINSGIDPPLSDATLRARAARGRQGAKAELDARKAGEAPGTAFAKPLVDTAQMRNAVNYVIRSRKKRG